jgi:4-hydroxy-2-oxoheptanedioate aldolase
VSTSFAARLRAGTPTVGFWLTTGCPPAAERLALLGYDYLCLDLQHGLVDYADCLAFLTAVDAAGTATVPLVRVPANDAAWIGRVLDAGAHGVIVPLVDTAEEAAAAVRACRYPPAGRRSWGALRGGLRIGPDPRVADDTVCCIVMIETAEGLANLDAICATPGLDAIYVGPSDLSLALGAPRPGEVAGIPEFAEAVAAAREAAARAGIAAGIHCLDGATAARRLAEGFHLTTVSSDLTHLEDAARRALETARDTPAR